MYIYLFCSVDIPQKIVWANAEETYIKASVSYTSFGINTHGEAEIKFWNFYLEISMFLSH